MSKSLPHTIIKWVKRQFTKATPTDRLPMAFPQLTYKAQPGQLLTLEGVSLFPTLKGSTTKKILGGLVHPDLPEDFQHRRYWPHTQSLSVTNDLSGIKDLPLPDRLEGSFLYGGPVIFHYGHFVAECSHRLYGWYSLPPEEREKTTILFLPKVRDKGGDLKKLPKVPPYIQEVFDYFGLRKDQILFLYEPKKVDRLIIPEQANILYYADHLTDCYLDFLERLAGENNILNLPQEHKKLYISRSRYLLTGTIAGEGYLEDFFKANGYTIYSPEDHRLKEQLMALQNADSLIFTEGSALHTLELLGKQTGEIAIIHRRDTTIDYYDSIIKRRYDSAVQLKQLIRLPTLSISDRRSNLIDPHSISWLDPDALYVFLEALNLDMSLFNKECFLQKAREDLDTYHQHYSQQPCVNSALFAEQEQAYLECVSNLPN